MTHAIILAAGEATRWQNYLGIPKHFIEINSEKIIERTIRLIKKFQRENTEIFVVGTDLRYKFSNSSLFIPKQNSWNAGVDKILNSKSLWNHDGKTIVFMGDVYFTENAMKKIMLNTKHEWLAFGRPGPSWKTGGRFGEIFALSFFSDHIDEHEKNLHKIVQAFHDGKIDRCQEWEHYRCMIGLEPTRKHIVGDKFIKIDDETDDFDFPEDYDNWMLQTKKKKSISGKIQLQKERLKFGYMKYKMLDRKIRKFNHKIKTRFLQ